MRILENELVNSLKEFLISEALVHEDKSHFDGDNDDKADVELVLVSERWSSIEFNKIYIEAKSHHSTDSQNTINKIFGQLLKETGKRSIDRSNECLAIVFPAENAEWIDNKKNRVTKISGVDYYRRGFSRINPNVFKDFGVLVGAEYIISYSTCSKVLDIYKWATFLDSNVLPVISLTSG